MNFTQEFIIHPVGQGLFYSGKIIFESEVKFRMVFDCGSITGGAGQTEVDFYRKDTNFLEEKILDLLVISHFDQDHVNYLERLLEDGIKVKKIVMPFVTFEERLFLVARCLSKKKKKDILDEFFIRLSIDPSGTLNEYLDGDSEIFIIDDIPQNPRPTPSEINNNENQGSIDYKRFRFDFEQKTKIESNKIDLHSPPSRGILYQVDHLSKGSVSSNNIYEIMDFLFYRRKIEEKDKAFFDLVKKIFLEKYSIDQDFSTSDLPKLINVIKEIKSAPPIKDIFKKAKAELELKTTKNLVIDDLNTTSLSLLHRNLKGIYNLVMDSTPKPSLNEMRKILREYSLIYNILNYVSDPEIRIEIPYYNYLYPHLYNSCSFDITEYPNVLLTSDGFLLTPDQVEEFLIHYRNEWEDFWLFQIPHHGSEKSSNVLLHSHILPWTLNFINFGIGNKDSHPSKSTILDLIATGNSSRIIPVTQYNGLRFGINI